MKTAIWWIRRDLRLSDNMALAMALEAADQILPVFVLDPKLLSSPFAGKKRKAFLFEGLGELNRQLNTRGSFLILRQGDPIRALENLCRDYDSPVIFAEPDYSPYARSRDQSATKGLDIQWVGSPSVHHPGTLLSANNKPYTIYTPFSRAWKSIPLPGARDILATPEKIPTPKHVQSDSFPSFIPDDRGEFVAGEFEAQRRLNNFIESAYIGIYQYGNYRDQLGVDGTSKLSPYLRFGMISARQAVVAAITAMKSIPSPDAKKGAETWLNELIWREFYLYILYHFPHVRRENFRLRGIRWENDPDQFQAWCEGRTGYPLVDAAMRQLTNTGWMHNRARMVVASFLTKDLLIDWRWGEKWFMQHLIDGDPASNNGGWQWTAGTGTDAAPYFRIFNPTTQSKRFDPEGLYIRKWLPELRNVPVEYIHEPWKIPQTTQEQTGCKIGKDYPPPIIDHSWARERALVVYGEAK